MRVSDSSRCPEHLDGQTGLRILGAILAGQRDPKKRVELRDEKCRKTTPEELEAALVGDWRAEHLESLDGSRERKPCLTEERSARANAAREKGDATQPGAYPVVEVSDWNWSAE